MAAVTGVVAGPRRVIGDVAMQTFTVSAANTGDTFVPNGYTIVDNIIATPPSTVAVTPNLTVSSSTITFNYTGGGTMVGIIVTVIGKAG